MKRPNFFIQTPSKRRSGEKGPTFFIVGAPRSGTTAMYYFLNQHPQIFMPVHKEPHYFATDIRPRNPWMKALRKRANYLKLFDEAKQEKRLGESSVLYLLSKKAAKNIKRFNPKTKIIIMLRSPIEVMYSLYYQLFYGGDENIATFTGALKAEKKRGKGKDLPFSLRMHEFYFYRKVADFTPQVKRYFDIFPKDQIKVIIYEDFKKDNARVYRETLAFLGVDTSYSPIFKRVNFNRVHRSPHVQLAMSYLGYALSKFGFNLYLFLRPFYRRLEKVNLKEASRPPMDKNLEKRLKNEFLPKIRQLGKIIGRDVTYWCK